jgi:hypothetical protein
MSSRSRFSSNHDPRVRRHWARRIDQTERAAKIKETTMDMRMFAGSSFITVERLRDGPREETINAIGPGKYERPVATFESGDKLSLNITNTNTLIKAYGPNDQDWIDCVIELAIGDVKYNGGIQEGVVVKPITPPKPPAAQTPVPKPPPPKPDMNDEIPF